MGRDKDQAHDYDGERGNHASHRRQVWRYFEIPIIDDPYLSRIARALSTRPFAAMTGLRMVFLVLSSLHSSYLAPSI